MTFPAPSNKKKLAPSNEVWRFKFKLNRKLTDEVNSYEERIAQLNRARQKLEQTLDQSEETLERERKARQDLDKQKRKTEGELKIAHENLEELGRQREELENAVKRYIKWKNYLEIQIINVYVEKWFL